MRVAVIVTALVLLGGCATLPRSVPTLYDRMGGAPVVKRVVDDIVTRVSTDPRTARSFKDSNLTRVREKLAEQVCELAGGPCKYTGDPMVEVHKGLKNTESEFYLMVQFVRDALTRAGVGEPEKNELLRLLAPMKREIVTG